MTIQWGKEAKLLNEFFLSQLQERLKLIDKDGKEVPFVVQIKKEKQNVEEPE
jgi:hypothetical protein